MRLRVAAVGQRMPAWVSSAWQDYAGRMPPHLALELVEIPVPRRARGADLQRLKRAEGQALRQAASGTHAVALDGRGRPWSTEQLAKQLDGWMHGGRDVSFLVGGPDGLDDECLSACAQRWSLGPLTLPHPLVRVVLAEQLYRAWTILGNHPYHRA
ncbi:MAG: 23S rRNA (pseudouridine(1915)-N(3))-methyltransferase RlmH [Xanthomonadales bacterium]|nr:23S rRNA (pseudouridine(1915)-N(3))-methyltransferase RlmH [Xanthomonadales bacterium]